MPGNFKPKQPKPKPKTQSQIQAKNWEKRLKIEPNFEIDNVQHEKHRA